MKRIALALVALLTAFPALAEVSDSRIRTLVYDENEVFKLVTHFGYQSNIEFHKKEEIQTISVGDNSAWQIVPAHRYLFIRAMQDDAHTNMTVITNKRTYQFDLRSSPVSGKKEPSLVYVIRFHYPEEAAAEAPAPTMASYAAPTLAEAPTGQINYNYNYTLSGPDSIAPLKVFDDGMRTYMQFSNAAAIQVFSVGADGSEVAARTSRSGDYVVVEGVQDKLNIHSGNQVVKVYNEARLSSMGRF